MKQILYLFTLLILIFSCKKEKDSDLDNNLEVTKKITWEEIYEFDQHVLNFAISGDGKNLFYSNNSREIYRVDLQSNVKTKLYGDLSAMGISYVHFIDNVLYTITVNDNKSYFGISTDLGENIVQHHVETHIPFRTDTLQGFLYVELNRLHKLSNGTLIVPTPSNMSFAISNDGGLSWKTKFTSVGYTYMPVSSENRLFALQSGWQGDYNIGSKEFLFYSDNVGETWLPSTLKYFPQAIDKNNNLIACDYNQIQKYSNGKWTIYNWDNIEEVWGEKLQYFTSGSQLIKEIADIEFDNNNNLYILVGNRKIAKTKLD